MFKTRSHLRPWASFDPDNKEHRKHYYNFVKQGSWKDCPYQWLIDDESSDVVHYIQRVMSEYYIVKEFATKKPAKRKSNTKVVKVVKIQQKP